MQIVSMRAIKGTKNHVIIIQFQFLLNIAVMSTEPVLLDEGGHQPETASKQLEARG